MQQSGALMHGSDPIFRIHALAEYQWDLAGACKIAAQHPQYRPIAEVYEEGDHAQALEWIAEAYRRAAFSQLTFFHAVPDNTAFLHHAPHLLNVLVSAFRLTESGKGGPIWRHLHLARRVFVDSGQISLLKLVAKGKAPAARLWQRMGEQDRMAGIAWRLHEQGVAEGVVAQLDHPCEPYLLSRAGMTVREAIDLTIENAVDFLDVQLPPGFRKVWVVQGWELEDYDYCLERFDHYGILDQLHHDGGILAVGSTCMRRPPSLYQVYELVRSRVPDAPIHALGIARAEWVGTLYQRGLINTADSGTASTQVGFNQGEYRVKGHRYNFLVHAQYAAQMLDLEYRIQQHIHRNLPGRPVFNYQMKLRDVGDGWWARRTWDSLSA